MALQRNNPAALRRRVVGTAVGADVIAALVIGVAISATIGWIIFVIGLVVAGFLYYNITQVMRTRGY